MIALAPISALLLSLASAQPPAGSTPNQPTTKLPSGKYAILKVSGDIDTDLFLRQVAAELDRARSTSLIILELDGNRARPDLIARLGQRLSTNTPPVAILLKDSTDHRVGIGQAMLAGFVKHSFIDPDTRIASSDSDDIRTLAPSDTSCESIEQAITGPLWRRLTELGGDQSLPPLLIAPSRDMWAVPVKPGEPWKLSPNAPAGGQSGPSPRQITWKDPARIELDAETAIGLRLFAGEARSMAPILTASNLSPRSTSTKRSIESSLPSAAATIPRILDDAKLALRRIATTLSIKPSDRTITTADYRRAGQSAQEQIARLEHELDRVESILADYPELNRTGATEKAARSDKGPWRPTIDALRKDLDKHRTTARDFASR